MLCGLIILGTGCSTDSTTTRARDILEETLANVGGASNIRSVESWLVEGSGRENLSAEMQGLAFGSATWRDHTEALAVDARTLTVAWQRRTPRNDMSLRWRRFVYAPDRFGFLDLTTEHGMSQPNPVPESERRALMRRIPHLLLLEATESDVVWRGEELLAGDDGGPHDVLDFVSEDSIRLTLFVSKEPKVLRRIEYQTHLPARGDVTVAWQWNGWQPDSLLGLSPAGHRVSIDTTLFQDVMYDLYAGNQQLDSWFDIPAMDMSPIAGGQRAQTPPFASTGEVAPGIHVNTVRGFGVMVVEFEDFVVAVEAPAAHPGLERIPATTPGNAVSDEHVEWVRTIAGARAVRYVVVTHHHSDHMGGLRAFLPEATIVVSPGDEAAVREMVTRPHTRAAGAEPIEAADSVSIETVPDRWVLQDGARTVEVIQVGANPHTDENLLVWIPAVGILFQGDLFYIGGNQTLPPSRATMNSFFVRWLYEHDMRPAAVYGVHNPEVAGPETLRRVGSSSPTF